jgi:hypothetical protein
MKRRLASLRNAPRDPQRVDIIELNFPNDVRDEKDFYGRKAELERIERTLLAGSGRPLLILGERRIGKTSLQTVSARRLATRDGDRFVPLFLPPARNIRSLSDYAKELLQCLCSYLGKNLKETGTMSDEGQFQWISAGHFRDTLARLLEEATDRTFIVCIDELDTILLESARTEAAQVLGLTDYIIEKADLPLVLCLTMTRLPEAETESFGSLNISKSEVIPLGPLPRREMEDMLEGILGGQVLLDDSAQDLLFGLSGGHPYVTKLLVDRLLARYWSEGTKLSVTQAMVEQVISDASDDPRARHAMANIYKVHFSTQEQQLAMLLSDRLIEGHTGLAAQELRILGPSFLKAAKVLARRGYLARDAQGGCDFRIKFLGWWLHDWEEYEEERENLNLEALSQKFDIDIEIDWTTRQVRIRGKRVELTPQEYLALACLCQRAGQLVTKDQLAQELWPEAKGDVSDAAIDATIYRLRGKLGDDARRPRYIKRVAGQGFILHRAAFVGQS